MLSENNKNKPKIRKKETSTEFHLNSLQRALPVGIIAISAMRTEFSLLY